jgi:uncharacterized protein (DUF983 family)
MKYVIFILQIVCISAVSVGLWIEVTYQADWGYILITGGSLVFAISVKLAKFVMADIMRNIINKTKNNDDV